MKGCQKQLILLVCASIVGSHACADRPLRTSSVPSPFVDVSLTPTGGLAGRFLDTQGQGIRGAQAVLVHGKTVVAGTATGVDGAYLFPTLPQGIYRVTIDGQSQMVRVWDVAIRPPAATDQLTMIRREPVMRGQQVSDSLAAQVGLAVGIGGAVAAGVAIAESQAAQQDTADLRRLIKVSSP